MKKVITIAALAMGLLVWRMGAMQRGESSGEQSVIVITGDDLSTPMNIAQARLFGVLDRKIDAALHPEESSFTLLGEIDVNLGKQGLEEGIELPRIQKPILDRMIGDLNVLLSFLDPRKLAVQSYEERLARNILLQDGQQFTVIFNNTTTPQDGFWITIQPEINPTGALTTLGAGNTEFVVIEGQQYVFWGQTRGGRIPLVMQPSSFIATQRYKKYDLVKAEPAPRQVNIRVIPNQQEFNDQQRLSEWMTLLNAAYELEMPELISYYAKNIGKVLDNQGSLWLLSEGDDSVLRHLYRIPLPQQASILKALNEIACTASCPVKLATKQYDTIEKNLFLRVLWLCTCSRKPLQIMPWTRAVWQSFSAAEQDEIKEAFPSLVNNTDLISSKRVLGYVNS